MKVGYTVILVGLTKATHLNGKLATVAGKDEGVRWFVKVMDDGLNTVG